MRSSLFRHHPTDWLLARQRRDESRVANRIRRICAGLTVLACLFGFSSYAGAQVATHAVYQGRLTEASGVAKTGPVDFTLRIFDAATDGTQLYSEQHLAVPLGPGGSFAVALGSGTSPIGSYAAALQTAGALHLEIEADGDPLGLVDGYVGYIVQVKRCTVFLVRLSFGPSNGVHLNELLN